MAFRSDPAFHVLHVVRIRGRVSTEGVAQAVGDGADDVPGLLHTAAGAGHMTFREGRMPGWSVTPEGRSAHAEGLAGERVAAGADHAVRDAYDRFLGCNKELIGVCTAYQLRPDGALNDHTDAAYDADVVAQLGAIDDAIQPVCADLATAMHRFSTYGGRLAAALAHVRAGEGQWFTSPMVESYHTVWFELHEDLLQTLGLERVAEGAG